MNLPIEIKYYIYDIAGGTPKQLYSKTMNQLRELNCQFLDKSYINNIIKLIYDPEHNLNFQPETPTYITAEEQLKQWNYLWYNYVYKHFFTKIASIRLKNTNTVIFSINKIFINFNKGQWTETDMRFYKYHFLHI